MFSFFKRIFRRTPDPVLVKTLKKQKSAKKSLKGLEWLNRIVVMIASVAIITYFLPNSEQFKYGEVNVGTPWHHPPLIALWKFNVNMSDQELYKKKDSIRQEFQPYFNIRHAVKDTVKIRIQNAAQQLYEDKQFGSPVVASYYKALLDDIETIYDEGVMGQQIFDSLKRSTKVSYIRILDNNIQKPPVSIENIYSIQGAYQKLMNPVEDNADMVDTLRKQFLSALNLNVLLEPNLLIDFKKSSQELKALTDSLSPNIGNVLQNEKIIDRGEIITPEKLRKIKAYEDTFRSRTENQKPVKVLIGQILFVLLIIIVLNTFLYIFRRDYFLNKRAYLMLFILPVFFCAITSTLEQHTMLHVYVVPFCLVPIIIRVFLDSRVAFVFHLATILLASVSIVYHYEFLVIQIIAGMVAVQTLRQMTQRSQIVKTMLLVTATLVATYFIVSLMTAEDPSKDPDKTDPYYWLVVSGLLLLFAYPLFWIMEKFFGFTSEVTLLELSNTNNPLLQKLMEEAPGTFQHSTQVAILASEVAAKVNANVQLVRTGALYHDIGKLSRPVFFTENQSGKNPHERISPVKSAEVIIAHVTEGVKLAEHYDLPEVIQRFIITHHGTGKVKYFYITYKNEHPEADIDESKFTYPGPNPESKEEAILMMADAVEAASRSLVTYTEETISALVDKIVQSQVEEGFFNDSNLTFKDVQIARKALKERLKTIYHTRISYPELAKNDEPETETKSEKEKPENS